MGTGGADQRVNKATAYVGASVDGFIARPGGSVDFLDAFEPAENDLGFAAFMDSVDALVMGRNTYDFVIDSGSDWPYGDKLVVVMTSRPLERRPASPGRVEDSALAPERLLAELSARGIGHVYVDGGLTIQSFLRAGLIDELIVTSVPMLIGAGIPLFGALEGDQRLEHLETTLYRNGFVQTRYRVLPR